MQYPHRISDPQLRADAREEWTSIWAKAADPLDENTMNFWLDADLPAEVMSALGTAQVRPGATLLEVGCGDGRTAVALADLGYGVTAIDVAETAIDQANARLEGRSTGPKFLTHDITEEPLEGPTFDAVLDRGCLKAIRTPLWPDYFRNAALALKPGGSLIVLYPFLNKEGERLADRFSAVLNAAEGAFTFESSANVKITGNGHSVAAIEFIFSRCEALKLPTVSPEVCKVFAGHSHIQAYLLAAVAQEISVGRDGNTPYRWMGTFVDKSFISFPPKLEWILPNVTFKGDTCQPNPAIMQMLALNKVFDDKPLSVILPLGGNEHVDLCLYTYKSQIYFAMPGQRVQPEAGDKIVPFQAIKSSLEESCKQTLGLLGCIKERSPHPIYLIEGPPPIECNDLLLAELKKANGWPEGDDSYTICRADVRRNFWKLRSIICADFCRANGVHFIRVPERLMEDGFLPEAYIKDATHANGLYGKEMLKVIDAFIAANPGHPQMADQKGDDATEVRV